jgi:hypothetical protein
VEEEKREKRKKEKQSTHIGRQAGYLVGSKRGGTPGKWAVGKQEAN